MRHALMIVALFALSIGCGEDNVADCETGRKGIPCTPRTAEEDARRALDESPPNYGRAIELLEPLITAEPESYARHVLLGASYAGRGGISILQLVESQLDDSGNASGSLIGSLSAILPDPLELQESYDGAVADVGRAVSVLQLVPNDATDADARYAVSAGLQLTLYRSAYSVMYLNKFVISPSTGAFDPALLATMTEADALVVIQTLIAAGGASGIPGSEVIGTQASDTVAAIQAAGGATNVARLQSYVAASQGGAQAQVTLTKDRDSHPRPPTR